MNDSAIPENAGVAIEYNIPQTSKRIDFIISDYGEKREPNVVIIELKQWDKVEAAELLECFQWSDKDYDLQHIKEELADVMVYSQNLLDKLGFDADEIINMKLSQNEAKYPIDKAKGKADKYDWL